MDVFEPAGLGERGSRIWQEFKGAAVDSLSRSLLDEVARTADRLDELDNIIQGKGVLNLMQFRVLSQVAEGEDLNVSVEVKFNAVMAEARQMAAAFAGLVKSFQAVAGANAATVEPASVGADPEDAVDELLNFRLRKEAK